MKAKDHSENYGGGWIKLYRSVRNHWIHRNPLYFRAWCDIMLLTNHDDEKELVDGELIPCDRGQKIYSIQTWAKIFGKGWSRQKVRTFFKLLENDDMIETEGLRKTTRLTVLNYRIYQDKITNSQPTDNQQPTNSQPQYKKNKKLKKPKKNTLSHSLQIFVSENYPRVSRLKDQLTEQQCESLLQKHSKESVKGVLDSMENYKPLTSKYVSVYKTALKWLEKDSGNSRIGNHDMFDKTGKVEL